VSQGDNNDIDALTPAKAGRQAAVLAQQQLKENRSTRDISMSSRLAHAGIVHTSQDVSIFPTNTPLAPPIHLATTYTRPPHGEYHETDAVYSRMDNPTRRLLEYEMGRLDGFGMLGEDNNLDNTIGNMATPAATSTAWSSGLAAVTGLILAHQAPLTVLLPADVYHGTSSLLQDVLTRFGVSVRHVRWHQLPSDCNSDQHDAWHSITHNISESHSVIVWLETPSNPLCYVTDMRSVVDWTHEHLTPRHPSTTVVVDSTLAPPVIQRPLSYAGVDVVLHSATKYLAGHSDALVGILSSNPHTTQGRYLCDRLPTVQTLSGATCSPWDAWLCLRGLRTLHVRVKQQCQTALHVATWLQDNFSSETTNPKMVKVHYPGLPTHPHHAVAQRQMIQGLYGGVMSVDMGSEARAMAMAAALQTIQRATSLGGTETLIEHRASIEPPTRRTSPPGLLRLSIGLESADDLTKDLAQAITIADTVCGGVYR
jgi:cystathionine gamma-synthase